MKRKLLVDGVDLDSLIISIKKEERELRKQGEALPYKYEAKVNNNDDEEQAVDIIALVLSGMAGAIGKAIIDYLASRTGVDMTLKLKNERGDECSFVFKNRSITELRRFLDENGFSTLQNGKDSVEVLIMKEEFES